MNNHTISTIVRVAGDVMRAPMTVLTLFAAAFLTGCRDEQSKKEPAVRIITPAGKTARERQEKSQAQFVTLTSGAAARLIWVEDPSQETSDTFAETNTLHLMGWDTREGGPRRLVGSPGNFGRPLLTPDGRQIVFTEKRLQRRGGKRHLRPRMQVIPWEGGEARSLGDGFAVDIWSEPVTGRIWIYALEKTHSSPQPGITGSTLVRFPLDDPDRRETVWTRTKLSLDSVQISRDGSRFVALFPWPDAGLGEFKTGHWKKLEVGCWPGFAPDDSYVAWVFDGPHRNLRMVAPEGDRRWAVNIAGGPDLRGKEAYHPRWSNHPEFFVFTGPYTKKKKGTRNAISTGGLTAEVHIGKFTADLSRLEATVRLTNNKNGDFYPALWVEGGGSKTLVSFPQRPASATTSPAGWPSFTNELVFAWRDQKANNELQNSEHRQPCRLEAHGVGRFTAYLGALLDGGWFEVDAESNAAITASARDGKGITLQALLTEPTSPPASPPRVVVPLLAWLTTSGEAFFSLTREDQVFRLALGTGPARIEKLYDEQATPGKASALAVVLDEGNLRLAINGKWVGEATPVPAGLWAAWPDGRLIIGKPPSAHADAALQTQAALERITVHAQALPISTIQAQAEIDLAATRDRSVPPRVRIRARVLEATDPDPTSLDTYSRMLIDHTYEVTQVLEGSIEAKKISVLHWAVLDDQIVPGYPRALGSEVELTIEPHASHTELEGELTDLTSEEFGLPLFLDVATPTTPTTPVR